VRLSAVRIGQKLRILAKNVEDKLRLVADCCCAQEDLLVPHRALCAGDTPQIVYVSEQIRATCLGLGGGGSSGFSFEDNCYEYAPDLPFLTRTEAIKRGHTVVTNQSLVTCVRVPDDCPNCDCCLRILIPVDICNPSNPSRYCCEMGTEYAIVYTETFRQTNREEVIDVCSPTCHAQVRIEGTTTYSIQSTEHRCACNERGQRFDFEPRCGSIGIEYQRNVFGTDYVGDGCGRTPVPFNTSEQCTRILGGPNNPLCPQGAIPTYGGTCPRWQIQPGPPVCNQGRVTKTSIFEGEPGAYLQRVVTEEEIECRTELNCSGGRFFSYAKVRQVSTTRDCGSYIPIDRETTLSRSWQYIRIRSNDCQLNLCGTLPPPPDLPPSPTGTPLSTERAPVNLFNFSL
jgi:hypothetical protein